MTSDLDLYRLVYRIRRFEETVLENFPKGIFSGTTHTYLGQEANAAGIISQIGEDDIVFSSHRCHGHFLAYGGNPRSLFAEMMGKTTGVCGGRGGSQHLHWRNFYSNGIQGGIVPVATGMALAEKIRQSRAVTIAFLGDGTLGEGVLYESLNLAALWQAPIFFVLEDNQIAQTTPVELAVSGGMLARFNAFGIQGDEIDTSDPREVLVKATNLITEVRSQQSPRLLIVHTFRFGPHSKGDDTRDPELIAAMRSSRDPVQIQAKRLAANEVLSIKTSVDDEIALAFETALADPDPDPKSLQ